MASLVPETFARLEQAPVPLVPPSRVQPGPAASPPVSAGGPERSSRGEPPSLRRGWRQMRPFAFLGGVLLPLLTLGCELLTGMCAQALGDPIPTWVHAAAIASLALANAVGWWWLARGGATPRQLRTALHLNAWAVGVSVPYALAFLPLMPFAAMGVAFYGLGLLPLAPAFALAAGLVQRTRLQRALAPHGGPRPRARLGVLAAWAVLMLAELPAAITQVALWQLEQTSKADGGWALAWLRRADPQAILATQTDTDLGLGPRTFAHGVLLPAVDSGFVETALYRAHGVTANEARALGRRPLSGVGPWAVNWDFAQGGEVVGRTLAGLSLAAADLDVDLAPDAGVGTVAWTLRFANEHTTAREARALVQLPPGSVVSEVTLWINGEPRPAAFGATAQVRAAYDAIVRRQRDPLLVTWAGPDTVLVQCFPVPVGGEMQIRLGVSCPLVGLQPEVGALRLPRLVERNFALPAGLTQSATVRGGDAGRLTLPGGFAAQPEAGGNWSGALAPEPESTADLVLTVARDPAASRVARAGAAGTGPWIAPAATSPAWVVVDGSATMAPWRDAIAAAVAAMRPEQLAGLVLAADGVQRAPDRTPAAAAAWLRAQVWRGGQDSTPALQVAVEALAAAGGGSVLWIQGAQRLAWHPLDPVQATLARAGGAVRIVALPLGGRDNVVARALGTTPGFRPALEFGPPEADLQRLLGSAAAGPSAASWSGLGLAGARAPGVGPVDAARPGAAALAALGTAERVTALIAAGQREEAVALAIAARLVTPVTGAVVLETQAQYTAAGLEPPPAPGAAIPEPATVALGLGLSGFAIAVVRRWRRRRGGFSG